MEIDAPPLFPSGNLEDDGGAAGPAVPLPEHGMPSN